MANKDRELHITATDVSTKRSDSPLSDTREVAIMHVKVDLLRQVLALPNGLKCV